MTVGALFSYQSSYRGSSPIFARCGAAFLDPNMNKRGVIVQDVMASFLARIVPKELQSRWSQLLRQKPVAWRRLDSFQLTRALASVRVPRSSDCSTEEYLLDGMSHRAVMRVTFGHDVSRADIVDVKAALGSGHDETLEGVLFTESRYVLLTHEGDVFFGTCS